MGLRQPWYHMEVQFYYYLSNVISLIQASHMASMYTARTVKYSILVIVLLQNN